MSSPDLPSTHRAIVVNAQQTGWVLKEQSLPLFDPATDVLVRVHAVALNPTDWKHLGAIKPGGSIGSDFGGVVCRGGGGYEVGDRVAGFTRGGYIQFDNGAFAGEFVRALLYYKVLILRDSEWKFRIRRCEAGCIVAYP